VPRVQTDEQKANALVTEEQLKVAAEQLRKQNEGLSEGEIVQDEDTPAPVDFNKPRTKGNTVGRVGDDVQESELDSPYKDLESMSPAAFAAQPVAPITGNIETQQFIVDYKKFNNLHFGKPGLNLPKKRQYTVKAFHKDGRLVQLPFEGQIQNNAGGDPEDAIGLRRYQRKGIVLLFDFETMQPVYCAAWGCWARADGRTGFCTDKHAAHTLPNRYKDAGEIVQGLMSQGVTTSRTWSI
jgi:hypothetical protein